MSVISLFVLYSALGWIIDTAYRSVLAANFAPGSISILPLTPIYGFGALAILFVSEKVKNNSFFTQFIAFSLTATFIEYLGGLFSTVFLKKTLWDYSEFPFNLHGYIDLRHSLYWGLLGLILVHILQPLLQKHFPHFHIEHAKEKS